MTDITSIPLNKLVAWNGNVRKTAGADTALAELAASIAAHGLISNLVVQPAKKGVHAVVTGGRRLAALRSLADAGRLPADHPTPCQILSGQASAHELSLAENAVREQMHSADEFEAFRKLADDGMPTADIAARFGVTDRVVLQRLKLARVSPEIIQAYRESLIDLECVMAFAVTDDHKRQEHFWKTGPSWAKTSPGDIRNALTDGEIDASDRRVKFVTLLCYENAGGTVRRDLFTNGDDGIFIDNVELLNKLVADRIEETTATLLGEGWKWVEFLPERGYEVRGKLKRFASTEGPLPAALQAEYEKLSAEHNKLESKKDPSEADDERYSEIEDRLQELDRERPEVFTTEQIAISGVFLEIQHDGELDIQRGYVRPEDVKAAKAANPEAGDTKAKPAEKAGLSQSLQRDLHAHRTAATAALLMEIRKSRCQPSSTVSVLPASTIIALAGRSTSTLRALTGPRVSAIAETPLPSMPSPSAARNGRDDSRRAEGLLEMVPRCRPENASVPAGVLRRPER